MRGIVFDFGNVIYRADYSVMARTLAGDRMDEFLAVFVGQPIQGAYETGRADISDVLRELRRKGFPLRKGHFLEGYLSIFSPIPGTRRILECLCRRRPLGLLSNTSPEHARLFIEAVPEIRLFDQTVYSFEVGCMKPDARIYQTMIRRLGLPGPELVYIDDVEQYARAAAHVGMTGLTFREAGPLCSDLLEMGFSVLRGILC